MERRATLAAFTVFFVLAIFTLQSGIDSGRKELHLSSTGASAGASALLQPLGGVKTAIAAYLWIRIDHIHDEYYGDLREESELMPLYRIITWLDHRFEDAYYVGSYMLYQQNHPEEGWRFALEGLRLNPKSAYMEFNVGQLALVFRKDYKGAVRHLERSVALSGNDYRTKFSALSNLRTAYLKAGKPAKAEKTAEHLAILVKAQPTLSSFRPELDK